LAPSINQIELHPQFQNRFAAQASFRMGVPVEAWAPLGQGSILREPLLNEVAGRLEVSPAQVVVAWHLLNGRVVIPKSRRREKMKENFDAQSLKLSVEDKTLIDSLDQGERGRLGPDPDTFYLPEPGLHLVEGVGERNTK
jgi:2,5-diketo-D-gluconate reductase A